MTVQQLILNNSDKVRRDSSLMAFYIECFTEAFGYKPKCTGCTFSTDWNKLVRFVNKGETPIYQNKNTMNTFKIKKVTNTIYAYKLDKKVYRRYDNKFDEAFVTAFLTNGTEAEITERKKLFAVLPESILSPVEVLENKIEVNDEVLETEKTEGEEIVEGVNIILEAVAEMPTPKKKRVSKKKK